MTSLAAASLEGPASVPSNATFRFAGLGAAVIGDLGRLRGEDTSSLAAAIRSFYLRLRGRLGGSAYAPRDVQEAFAVTSSRLFPVATDPARFDVVARLFAECRARRSVSERTAEQRELIATATADWPKDDAHVEAI